MAISIERKKSAQVKVRVSDEIRNVRDRYAEALRLGYSAKEAARLAQGKEKLPSAPQVSTVQSEPKIERQPSGGDATAAQTVNISGNDKTHVDIPPNWEDLPWPNLKTLAESLNGGRDVKSRKLAHEIIEQSLAGETNSQL